VRDAKAYLVGAAIGVAFVMLGVRACRAQVPTFLEFDGKLAEASIRNPGHEPAHVTVVVWRSLSDSAPPVVLVAPRAFDLAPGEAQTVRVLLREPCSSAWRWATTILPSDSGAIAGHAGLATIRLRTQMRLVGRVTCH